MGFQAMTLVQKENLPFNSYVLFYSSFELFLSKIFDYFLHGYRDYDPSLHFDMKTVKSQYSYHRKKVQVVWQNISA